MDINALANMIKDAREKKGLSQRELARELNISNSELSRIEKGERQKPDIDILTKIANILNLSLRDMLKLAGYDEILLSIWNIKNKETKSIIDYKRDLKEYERFYFDILDDSRIKRENVRNQRSKLTRILDKYELAQITGTNAPTLEEVINIIKDVNEELKKSQEKYDYKKLPKV